MHPASSPLSASAYAHGGAVGLIVLGVILFAETGLLVGFFLPGDTLLLLIGDYTNGGKAHHINLGSAIIAGLIGAIVGAQTGYVLGRIYGPRVFDKPRRRERLERTHNLLVKLGEGRSAVAARFIPIVRTFMNPALGATGMKSHAFTLWNVVGAVLWIPTVLILGRAVGANFPLDKIVIVVMILSLLAPLVERILHGRRSKGSTGS